jgi:hypothetical protein
LIKCRRREKGIRQIGWTVVVVAGSGVWPLNLLPEIITPNPSSPRLDYGIILGRGQMGEYMDALFSNRIPFRRKEPGKGHCHREYVIRRLLLLVS